MNMLGTEKVGLTAKLQAQIGPDPLRVIVRNAEAWIAKNVHVTIAGWALSRSTREAAVDTIIDCQHLLKEGR